MSISALPPTIATAPSGAMTAILTVPAGEEWSVNLRVCVGSGTVDDTYDLMLYDTGGTGKYRARAHPVPYQSGTQDIEQRLVLPAGYSLRHRSGAGVVDATFTGTRRTL